MADAESYKGDCPRCGAEDVWMTPDRFKPERVICFNCGGDVNAPMKGVPLNQEAMRLMSFDATPPVEDMQYDERVETDLGKAEAEEIRAGRVSKAQLRRARRNRMAKARQEVR